MSIIPQLGPVDNLVDAALEAQLSFVPTTIQFPAIRGSDLVMPADSYLAQGGSLAKAHPDAVIGSLRSVYDHDPDVFDREDSEGGAVFQRSFPPSRTADQSDRMVRIAVDGFSIDGEDDLRDEFNPKSVVIQYRHNQAEMHFKNVGDRMAYSGFVLIIPNDAFFKTFGLPEGASEADKLTRSLKEFVAGAFDVTPDDVKVDLTTQQMIAQCGNSYVEAGYLPAREGRAPALVLRSFAEDGRILSMNGPVPMLFTIAAALQDDLAAYQEWKRNS